MDKMASTATEIVSAPISPGMQVVAVIFAIVIGAAYWYHVLTLRVNVDREYDLAEKKLNRSMYRNPLHFR